MFDKQEVTRKIEESLPDFQSLVVKWRYNLRERSEEMAAGLLLPAIITVVVMAVLAATAWKFLGLAAGRVPELGTLQKSSPALFVVLALIIIYWRVAKVVQPVSSQLASYFKFAPHHWQQLGYQHKVIKDLRVLHALLKPDNTPLIRQALNWVANVVEAIVGAAWRGVILCFCGGAARMRKHTQELGTDLERPLAPERSNAGGEMPVAENGPSNMVPVPEDGTSDVVPVPEDGPPKVVVFVDDLDRCSDKSVVSTLEAINLVLGGGKFLVVVGMDKNIVGDAIQKEQKYTDKEKASDYLAKIVQVFVHLPRCTDLGMRMLLHDVGVLHYEGKNPEERMQKLNQSLEEHRSKLATAAPRPQEAKNNGKDSAAGQDPEIGRDKPSVATEKDSTADQPILPGPILRQQLLAIPHRQRSRPKPPPPLARQQDIDPSRVERDTICQALLCMGSVSPRSLKRLINMHRLAKAILFRDVDLKAGLEAALVVWVMLTWRYCKQLNWWLAGLAKVEPGAASADTGSFYTAVEAELVEARKDEAAAAENSRRSGAAGETSNGEEKVEHAAAGPSGGAPPTPEGAAAAPSAQPAPERPDHLSVAALDGLADVLWNMQAFQLGLKSKAEVQKQYRLFQAGLEVFGVNMPRSLA